MEPVLHTQQRFSQQQARAMCAGPHRSHRVLRQQCAHGAGKRARGAAAHEEERSRRGPGGGLTEEGAEGSALAGSVRMKRNTAGLAGGGVTEEGAEGSALAG
eukprot:151984-Chlamydomonas_euryale.AAC.5